jgi:uncharacterized protein
MSEANGNVRILLEQIVKGLVERPDEVVVDEIEGETVVLELTVSPDDVGKVIGRQGRVARALRSLIGAASAGSNKRFALEIVE